MPKLIEDIVKELLSELPKTTIEADLTEIIIQIIKSNNYNTADWNEDAWCAFKEIHSDEIIKEVGRNPADRKSRSSQRPDDEDTDDYEPLSGSDVEVQAAPIRPNPTDTTTPALLAPVVWLH